MHLHKLTKKIEHNKKKVNARRVAKAMRCAQCAIDRQNANELRWNYEFSPHLNWNDFFMRRDNECTRCSRFVMGVWLVRACAAATAPPTAARLISFTFTLTHFRSHCVLRISLLCPLDAVQCPLCYIAFLVLHISTKFFFFAAFFFGDIADMWLYWNVLSAFRCFRTRRWEWIECCDEITSYRGHDSDSSIANMGYKQAVRFNAKDE